MHRGWGKLIHHAFFTYRCGRISLTLRSWFLKCELCSSDDEVRLLREGGATVLFAAVALELDSGNGNTAGAALGATVYENENRCGLTKDAPVSTGNIVLEYEEELGRRECTGVLLKEERGVMGAAVRDGVEATFKCMSPSSSSVIASSSTATATGLRRVLDRDLFLGVAAAVGWL